MKIYPGCCEKCGNGEDNTLRYCTWKHSSNFQGITVQDYDEHLDAVCSHCYYKWRLEVVESNDRNPRTFVAKIANS